MSDLHPSIQPDETVKGYYSDKNKYYYLPLFKNTLFQEQIAKILGVNNSIDRTKSEIRNSFVKAQFGQYSHIKIPFDRFNSKIIQFVYDCSLEYKIPVILQVATSFLYDEVFYKSLKELPSDQKIEWVVDECHHSVIPRLSELHSYFQTSYASIAVHKDIEWFELLTNEVVNLFESFHLHFPYSLDPSDKNLDCHQIFRVLKRLRTKYPKTNFLPPKGVDLWDPRVTSEFDMEPFLLPCFETASKSPQIKYSVVIPSFNNQDYLQIVIKNLYKQDIGLDSFEVIVVDDGSGDCSQKVITELVDSFSAKMNFKYIFFPRTQEREMGDGQYRAGISRNLGAKNSVGEYLCFLDSDIVVPKNYLRQVGKDLQTWGAVQAKRYNLTRERSLKQLYYDDVNQKFDIDSGDRYWSEFTASTKWHQRPYNWKYVCTHSFSMRRDVFWEVGGLKRNFIFYGFEDTDLGYRLVKAGYELFQMDLKVFHLFHEDLRSEFMNNASIRHRILSRTAQIFYLHNLDDEIYKDLNLYMSQEPTIARFLDFFKKTCTLQLFWKEQEKVFSSFEKPKTKVKLLTISN